MGPQLDVGKVVGAASAPVALIIATSIFLSNLGAKYAMLAAVYRELLEEHGKISDTGELHAKRLHRQLQLYALRIRILMRATFWLTLAIQCFIFTVVLTGVGVIFPQSRIWTWSTVFFSFAGLFVLGASVVIEMYENHLARRTLMLYAAETPSILSRTDLGRTAEFSGLTSNLKSGEPD
jgi:Protein of unknown function (DUF2721)